VHDTGQRTTNESQLQLFGILKLRTSVKVRRTGHNVTSTINEREALHYSALIYADLALAAIRLRAEPALNHSICPSLNEWAREISLKKNELDRNAESFTKQKY